MAKRTHGQGYGDGEDFGTDFIKAIAETLLESEDKKDTPRKGD